MKPIIVTYSNESYIVNAAGWLSITGPEGTKPIPNAGYFSCTNMETGQFADVFNSQIKLFARPIRKRKTPVTNY
jgi:hypothetical protein